MVSIEVINILIPVLFLLLKSGYHSKLPYAAIGRSWHLLFVVLRCAAPYQI